MLAVKTYKIQDFIKSSQSISVSLYFVYINLLGDIGYKTKVFRMSTETFLIATLEYLFRFEIMIIAIFTMVLTPSKIRTRNAKSLELCMRCFNWSNTLLLNVKF